MSHLLHYPRRSCSLNDLAKTACVNPQDVDSYVKILASANRKQADVIQSKTSPILLTSNADTNISFPQCTMQEHKALASLSHTVGGAGVMALADLVWGLTKNNSTTFAGGAGEAISQTSDIIVDSVNKYQKELKVYEDLRNHGAVKATLNRHEPKVRNAFNKMNTVLDAKGQHFLHKYAAQTRETKNLNGRIVRESIPITNHRYVKKLSHLAKVGKVAGPGLVLLDGFMRYNSVSEMYKAKDAMWKRQAVVETSSFVAGIAAAGAIATFVVLMTPAGLVVGLVAGGIAAVGFDWGVKLGVGAVYDLF